MKKFFTFCLVLAFSVISSFGAKQITGEFGSWGETCVIEGNTLTFTAAWAGAGFNLIDGTGIEYGGADYSDYDYIWVTFDETTCDYVMTVQYFDGTSSDGTNYDYVTKDGSSASGISGSKIIGVKLDLDCSGDVTYFFLQSQSVGSLTVSGVYAGTQEEYEALLAGMKPEKSDLSLSDLGSGWGNSTYDAATQTVTIGDDWSGKGWWLGTADYSDFDKFVLEFAEPTATNGKLVIQYNDGTSNEDDGAFEAGTSRIVCDLSATGKSSVMQIYLQGPAGSVYKLSAAYVALESYVTDIKSAAVAADNSEVVSVEYYNAAGQKISAPQKGLVIKKSISVNGSSVVRKMIIK